MNFDFDNSYAQLPPQFYSAEQPRPPAAPVGLVYNTALGQDLGLSQGDDWANVFSGAVTPKGAANISQAYAGHQFGHWAGALGDGRAIMLGEINTPKGRFDIQLKGAGPTRWSRRGDGLAWYGPVLREYLVSESMHALGIPTTRALAAVATGDMVYRDTGSLPGAVLTRVAPSHIRVGTFQYFAATQDHAGLSALLEHTLNRHYPDASTPADFLRAVCAAQVRLVAKWMGVGFIHGVMNTDNAHVAGITIDYGPCAFVDAFHPQKVFSSIDHNGRYAYGNQPQMAAWNMAQLATALLPLEPNQDTAIQEFTKIVHEFGPLFDQEYQNVFAAKLGVNGDDTRDLIDQFMDMMTQVGADFTQSFRSLFDGNVADHLGAADGFDDWYKSWAAQADPSQLGGINPAIIPRNHIVEQMITNAVAGDLSLFHRFYAALQTPFATPHDAEFLQPPSADNIVHRTFCGT